MWLFEKFLEREEEEEKKGMIGLNESEPVFICLFSLKGFWKKGKQAKASSTNSFSSREVVSTKREVGKVRECLIWQGGIEFYWGVMKKNLRVVSRIATPIFF